MFTMIFPSTLEIVIYILTLLGNLIVLGLLVALVCSQVKYAIKGWLDERRNRRATPGLLQEKAEIEPYYFADRKAQ